MDELFEELIEVVLGFLPGLEVGNICRVSKWYNKCCRKMRRKMILIHKVRARLMSNVIWLIRRHIYYEKIKTEAIFDPTFYCDVNINSYKEYKSQKEQLISSHSNIEFELIYCRSCDGLQTLNYYIFDSYDDDDENYINVFCYQCYHRGVIGYYNHYSKLPSGSREDSYYDLIDIMNQTIGHSIPDIPPVIAKYFNNLEGGAYNWAAIHD